MKSKRPKPFATLQPATVPENTRCDLGTQHNQGATTASTNLSFDTGSVVREDNYHEVQQCQAIGDGSVSLGIDENALHKGCATEEKFVCEGVASRTRFSSRKKSRDSNLGVLEKAETTRVSFDQSHVINKKPKKTKDVVNSTTVLIDKDEMAGVKIDVDHEVNDKFEGTEQIVKTFSIKRTRRQSLSSVHGVESTMKEMTDISPQRLPVSSLSGTSLHGGSVVSVARVADEASTNVPEPGVNNDPSHVRSEKHEETKHIVQTRSKKRKQKSQSIDDLSTNVPEPGVNVDTSHARSEKHEETKHIVQTRSKKRKQKSQSTENLSTNVPEPGVNVDTSHARSEKHEETKHIVQTRSKKRKKKSQSTDDLSTNVPEPGVNGDTTHARNEKHEETKGTVLTRSKKRKRKHRSTDDLSTIVPVPGVNVDTTLARNEKHEETKHIVLSRSKKRKMRHRSTNDLSTNVPGVNIAMSHARSERHEETKHIVQTRSKKRNNKSLSTDDLSTNVPEPGVNFDMSHARNEKHEKTKHIVEAPFSRRKRKPRSKRKKKKPRTTDDPSTNIPETVANIDMSCEIKEKPEKTKHIVKTCSKKRKKKSRSTDDTSINIPETGVNVDMSHGINEKPEETKHIVETSSEKRERKPRSRLSKKSKCIMKPMQEEVSVSGVTDDMSTTILPNINVTSAVLANEHPVEEQEKSVVTSKVKNTIESMLAVTEGGVLLGNVDNISLEISQFSDTRVLKSRRKLLILDVNGLLVDIVAEYPDRFKPNFTVAQKGVFKRPFCDDFLQFCIEKFDVGIWSSRTKKNLTSVVDFLMKKNIKNKLLFCWHQSHCTNTGYKTIENKNKPLVLKELKKLWENKDDELPWQRGFYDESNTILLDDSPYKALRNPPYTAVYALPYSFQHAEDNALGPNGDIRLYLERLAEADNVQQFIQANPFGQRPITKDHRSWNFYSKIAGTYANQQDKAIACTVSGPVYS
ncbi:hypothetical protein vseg_013791 [Gypsophila vaccaria]